jgi:branched-chain amino acid transport system permease protein
MIYREVGQFKASYAADQAIFPIRQDRWLVFGAIAAAYLVIPTVGSEYWLLTIMVPFLVYSLAALGLNLLTGYAGQLSLGTGGFMAVGAFATYKLTTSFPGLNIVLAMVLQLQRFGGDQRAAARSFRANIRHRRGGRPAGEIPLCPHCRPPPRARR